MTRALAKAVSIKLPDSLAEFLDDPPLVGEETRESYNTFFKAIVAGVEPANPTDWLYTKEVGGLSWQNRRERAVLASIVNSFYTDVVSDFLKATADSSNPLA